MGVEDREWMRRKDYPPRVRTNYTTPPPVAKLLLGIFLGFVIGVLPILAVKYNIDITVTHWIQHLQGR